MGGDEHFTLAWYLSQIAPDFSERFHKIESPVAHLAAKGGGGARGRDASAVVGGVAGDWIGIVLLQ